MTSKQTVYLTDTDAILLEEVEALYERSPSSRSRGILRADLKRVAMLIGLEALARDPGLAVRLIDAEFGWGHAFARGMEPSDSRQASGKPLDRTSGPRTRFARILEIPVADVAQEVRMLDRRGDQDHVVESREESADHGVRC